MKTCTKCNILKEYDDFPKRENRCKTCRNIHYNIYKKENVEKLKEYRSQYREANKEVLKEKRDKYYFENSEKLRVKSYKYRKENSDYTKYSINRRNNDPLYKLSHNISSLIRYSIKKGNYSKKSKTFEILGCSFEDFKLYIESKFEDWMTWNNNGVYNGEYNITWQFDHIIPSSSAKTEDDLIKLNHYSNFQPLCSKKNLEKSNEIY